MARPFNVINPIPFDRKVEEVNKKYDYNSLAVDKDYSGARY